MAQACRLLSSRRRIAVVDDDRNMALLLVYNLTSWGHDVTVITSGDGAVEMLIAESPELVVLDWGLPGLSVIEVLRRLRQKQATHAIPVIMLTGRNEIDDRKRALNMGANIFLSKPFAVSELMAHVETLLDRDVAPAGQLARASA